jgi:ADP-ribose pyrophosphatase YjhB (NUDIX family)
MNLKNNEPCQECGRYINRGVSVDAVIIKDGKILLIKRGREPFMGYWALPGGYVEWDESAEESVVREVAEEVGVNVDSWRLIGVYSAPDRHPKQVINIAFAVKVSGHPQAGDDALELKWYPLNDLPIQLAFDHKKIISDSQKETE